LAITDREALIAQVLEDLAGLFERQPLLGEA
jgi:hypothetical protein